MHHPNGEVELPNQIRMKMDLPSDAELETEEGFKEFLYQAQVRTKMFPIKTT